MAALIAAALPVGTSHTPSSLGECPAGSEFGVTFAASGRGGATVTVRVTSSAAGSCVQASGCTPLAALLGSFSGSCGSECLALYRYQGGRQIEVTAQGSTSVGVLDLAKVADAVRL